MRKCEICSSTRDLFVFFGTFLCNPCHSGLLRFYVDKMVADGLLISTGLMDKNGDELYAFPEETA